MRYGVRMTIDLRDPREHALEHDPFDRPELRELDHTEIPLLTADFWRGWHGGIDPHDGDLLVLETCREPVATLFAAFAAAPEGAVVVYCHAGKERTGIAAALLLELAGVDRAIIGREHALSDEHLAPLYAAWLEAEPDPKERQQLTHALRPHPEQMRTTLDALDELYGGIEPYLLDCGLGQRDLLAIRERLLE
jgi:hypothetical protein